MRIANVVLALAIVAGPALAVAGTDAELRKEAGNYFLKQRQYEEARDQYLAALQEDPDYADAHYNLGVVYFFRLQDYPRALYHLVQYAHLRPEAQDLDQVRSLAGQALEKIEAGEREAYGRALQSGSRDALEGFLREYPLSPYAADARDKLRTLKAYDDEVRLQETADQGDYMAALGKGTPEAMDSFLKDHPDSPHAAEARRLRDVWAEQRQADEQALEAARQEQTADALDRFLVQRPDSPLASQARAERDRLRASDDAFRIAAESRSAPALEVFLAMYGGTPREPEAVQLLEEIRREERVRRADDEAFAAASLEGTTASWEAFLNEHPNSAREIEARQRLAELRTRAQEEAAQREAEALATAQALREEADRAWAQADEDNSAAGYRQFMDRFPVHEMAEEARRRAAALSVAVAPPPDPQAAPPRVAPETAWTRALEEDTVEGYERFLAGHPEGEEAAAARERIAELQAGATGEAAGVPKEKRQSLERYRRMLQTD